MDRELDSEDGSQKSGAPRHNRQDILLDWQNAVESSSGGNDDISRGEDARKSSDEGSESFGYPSASDARPQIADGNSLEMFDDLNESRRMSKDHLAGSLPQETLKSYADLGKVSDVDDAMDVWDSDFQDDPAMDSVSGVAQGRTITTNRLPHSSKADSHLIETPSQATPNVHFVEADGSKSENLLLSFDSSPATAEDKETADATDTTAAGAVLHAQPILGIERKSIRCICGFNEDDGSTILCAECNNWQHCICYYPQYEDTSLPSMQHRCIECDPRPLDVKDAPARQALRQTGKPAEPLHEDIQELERITEELYSRCEDWHGLDFRRFGRLMLYGDVRISKDNETWQELGCYLFTEMLICVKVKKSSLGDDQRWNGLQGLDGLDRPGGSKQRTNVTLKGSILIKKHLKQVEAMPSKKYKYMSMDYANEFFRY